MTHQPTKTFTAAGSIRRGALVTSDGTGAVIAAIPAPGKIVTVVGIAIASAEMGDAVEVIPAPGANIG